MCKYDSGILYVSWRFSWRVHSWFGFLSFLLPSPHFILPGEGEAPLVFSSFWPYKFLQVSAMNLNVGNSPPFCFLPAPLFSATQSSLAPVQASWRQMFFTWNASPSLPSCIKKSEGVTLYIFQRSSAWLPPWELMYQSTIQLKRKSIFSLSVQVESKG